MSLDINFYRNFYTELEKFNDEEIILHFSNYGILEKRIYSLNNFYKIFPYFSLDNYKILNIDLNNLNNDIEYYKHYYFLGQFENRKCRIEDFSIVIYKLFNEDLNFISEHEYIKHYINNGIKENRIKSKADFYKLFPNEYNLIKIKDMLSFYKKNKDINLKYPRFKIEFYKIFNKDLKLPNDEEYKIHYLNNGLLEKRLICIEDFFNLYPDFNINLFKLSDIKLKNLNDIDLMYHFHLYGKNENYNNLLKLNKNIDLIFYKNFNKDLNFENDGEYLNHYYLLGKKEGRFTSTNNFYKIYPEFNLDIYKYFNKDLNDLNDIDLMFHFHNKGKIENRIYKLESEDISFKLEIFKKFHPEYKDYNNNSLLKIFIKSKDLFIENLSDFYNQFPDFNINIYKTFFPKNITYFENSEKSNSIESENPKINDNKDSSEESSNKKLENPEIDSANEVSKEIINKELANPEIDYTEIKNLEIDNQKLNNKNEQTFIDINKLNDIEILHFFYINYNKEAIYSLKTFYQHFPKFDYYTYRFKRNIENMGEVETIIHWYLNDLDFKFWEEEKIKFQKKNIIIYPFYEYSNNCGGVVVQFYLAKILDELGIKVRIKLNNNNYRPNNIYNNYENNEFDINNCIIIYGETIEGNPLKAEKVVRWILAELGIISSKNICKTWNNNDLIYYFNSEFKFLKNPDYINKIYKNLSLLFINPIFNNLNKERSGYCHTFRKSKYHNNIIKIHPENSYEITREHNQDDYLTIFNKYEFFISYDPLTFLNIIAGFCGCISIIYPIEGVSKSEWLKMTALADYLNDRNLDCIYGIAYGNSFNEILYAYSTMNFMKKQWDDINIYFKNKYIIPFINDINNWEKCENTNQNNFNI